MTERRGPLTEDLRENEEKDPVAAKEKKIWWRGFAAGAAVCVLMMAAVFVFGQSSAITVLRKGGLTIQQADELVNKVDTLFRNLDENYLETIDDDELLDGAYHGLVSAVGDKYTRYFNEEELKEYKESSTGQYVGIGVTVRLAEGGGAEITIIDESGPAYEAGLQLGDILVAADGTDLTELDLEAMTSLIKGEEGTKVEITYLRENVKTTVSVTRRTIDSKTVAGEMLEEGIGYIAISSFDGVTTKQFTTVLEDLKSQDLQGLIVDLRNNPGGRVDVVQKVTNELVPAGIITYTEDKNGNREVLDSTDDPYLNLPLVVLVNGNSGSASEIMAGAIQDRGEGILIGTTTYGKGIVQVTTFLEDETAIKVTSAKYYTPNGNYIHQIGITPDIEIDLPEGVIFSSLLSKEDDVQLQTALEALKTEMGR